MIYTHHTTTKPGHKIIYEKQITFGTPGYTMVPREVPNDWPDDFYDRIQDREPYCAKVADDEISIGRAFFGSSTWD